MPQDIEVPTRFVKRPSFTIDQLKRNYGLYSQQYANALAWYHEFSRRLIAIEFPDYTNYIDIDYA